uniref:Gag1-like clamp domain-containing protein n=1 Tax=Lactuca sativa TaxID=4236 RepID=A0A9R1WR35_LACSA|nr:hypothetical protein LSAT_V11C100014160 [Lactuca sativa]
MFLVGALLRFGFVTAWLFHLVACMGSFIGFLLWNQSRQQWIGNKRNRQRNKPREPRLSKNVTYDSLLGSNKPFAKPVPLSEMVDFLGDVWEQEGLYD